MVIQVLLGPFDFRTLNFHGPFVFLHPVPGKHLNVNHCTVHAGTGSERSILDIGCLFSKNGPKKLFFRSQLGFTLWCDLSDQDISRLDFGTDMNNPRFIKFGKRFFANVGNIRSNLFGSQLGIPSHAGFFLDMDRCEAVFFDHPMGNQDRVLEVVAIPGHERDEQVLAEG